MNKTNKNIKQFKLGNIKLNMEKNNFPKGLVLNRELTTKECRYIMYNLLGINIENKEDLYDDEEYTEYNNELRMDVNDWLIGNVDDSKIIEYSYGDFDSLGILNLIPILSYLKRKSIID